MSQPSLFDSIPSPVNTDALAGKISMLRDNLAQQEDRLHALLVRLRGHRPEVGVDHGETAKLQEEPSLLEKLQREVRRADSNSEMISELVGLVD